MLGNALKGRRQNVVLATKFGFRLRDADIAPGSRRNIRREVENSLRRLQTDYIDLYYLHHVDPVTPVEETLLALNGLVDEGKVLYVGACKRSLGNTVGHEPADGRSCPMRCRRTLSA
jgi:aryl-alcohol dehydrogenase-like predicted oxidoreductase